MPALARLAADAEKQMTVAAVIAAALLLHVADALLTYFIIATGRGIEANPAHAYFNHDPSAVFTVLAWTALALTAAYLLAVRGARSRRVLVAAASRTVMSMFFVFIALKTLVVTNNALILYSSVQLFEFAHYVVAVVLLSAAVAAVRLRSELTALRRRGGPRLTSSASATRPTRPA